MSGVEFVHLAEAKVLMRSDWKFNPRIARINANNETSMGPRPRGRGNGRLIPHLSLLDVTAFPQRKHGCLEDLGICEQPKDRDKLGVLALCCHLFGHDVNLVGSLNGRQFGYSREMLAEDVVPADDLDETG